MPISIAIDGPSGAGKSTIAGIIARRMKLIYLDTGAMYRACALKAIRLGISCSDKDSIDCMIAETEISFMNDGSDQVVFLDGENVSGLIRTPEVTKGSSDISAIASVRVKMVELQRNMADGRDVILDGRDIGTYVLPNATVKFFLTASADERANRRFREIAEKGKNNITLAQVRADMESRDYNDSNRALAPLRKAEDAIEVDTTGLTIEQVSDKIIAIIEEKCSEKY